jgi:ferredoxin-nitrite reductase
VAVGGAPDSFLLHNSLAFLPAQHNGELGFTVLVGGFFSAQRNELAVPLGLWLRAEQLADFTLAVLHHFERKGNRQQRNKSRLMYLIDQLGIDVYRDELVEAFAEPVLPHDGSHLVNRAPRSGLGVHGQKQAGLHWVGLHVPMGRLEAAKLFLGGSMGAEPKLAELHHKGVPLSDLPDVLEQLFVEHFGARRRQ